MQPRKTPVGPLIGIVVGFVCVALLQTRIDSRKPQYDPARGTYGQAASKLPIEFALGAATGFREAIAGLLWVRTDDFFHSGEYKAIPPMIRIITWLDPHNLDVYETGAWHLDYNFTDTQERSDRRYIPLSIALEKEGIANNPDLPEMYADLAFTHYYRKIGDYTAAAETLERGQAVVDRLIADGEANPKDETKQYLASIGGSNIVMTTHALAHAYEACGQIDKALAQWQKVIHMHQVNATKPWGKTQSELFSGRIAQKQYAEMLLRRKWRANLARDPLDVQFDVQLKRIAPKVFLVSGHLHTMGSKDFKLEQGPPVWAPYDGARVDIRLQDQGYRMPVITNFDLKTLTLNPDTTVLQDSVAVRADKFERKLDMSKDPDFYSFTGQKYELVVWFNPCNPLSASPALQDRVGWLGEGLTDKRYLDTSGVIPGDISAPIPGLRMVKKTFVLTRDDILGTTEAVFH